MALLRQTLRPLDKKFTLALRRVDAAQLEGFPPLNASLAAYYRLLAAQLIEAENFLYLDADILCDADVSELSRLDIGSAPAGMVAEAPMATAVDRFVARQLGDSSAEPYFNSGVIWVNVAEWRRQRVTERAMQYIAEHRPPFWDQSALNVVLHRSAFPLNERFNCITNMRRHWPDLRKRDGATGRVIHFVDYPKPWGLFGEFVHPQYRRWRSVLDKTAMRGFRSWHATPCRRFPGTRKDWIGYRKALKDRVLFAGYSNGWFKQVKGVGK